MRSVKCKILSEKFSVKEHVFSSRRMASSIDQRFYLRSSSGSVWAHRFSLLDRHSEEAKIVYNEERKLRSEE